MYWKLLLLRKRFVNKFFYANYCSVKVVSETGFWKVYNVNSGEKEPSIDIWKRWFDPKATTLFAFQSIGRWQGNLVQQAPRLDWQYTLRSLVQWHKKNSLPHSSKKDPIPLIFIELSQVDLKNYIAAFGVREPVISLSCLKDWQVLVDQLALDSEWKTVGLNLLQRKEASWLFKLEQKIFYGFHDFHRSSSYSMQCLSVNGEESLPRLVSQAQPSHNDSTEEKNNVEKVASNLQFNALDSWYAFRELEYQQRLAFAELGPQILLQVPQTLFRYPRDAVTHFDKNWIFVSDTFHHRIVVLETSGKMIGTIGCGVAWFRDDDFSCCAFHQPSGIALNGDTLYIADTENGCVRMANVESGHVSTIYPSEYRISSDNNMTRALDFCDIWRTPWKVTPKHSISWNHLEDTTRFGRPLAVVVKDKVISILTIAPLAIWELSLSKDDQQVEIQSVQLLEKQFGRDDDNDVWMEYLQLFSNTPERISVDTTHWNPLHKILKHSNISQLEYLPPPWTLHSIRDQVSDYDAFQYIYPYLRGRKMAVEDSLYLIPGIARLVIYITLPAGYIFAGKTLTHVNMQGPIISTTPPLGIDDNKIPKGERSRRRLEGLDEPQDLVLPEPPEVDSFSGLPIVIDMYTFPGNGYITVDLVVYLTRKENTSDNGIFYDTIQLKAPVRVTSYGFETEYLYVTSRIEPPNYETISVDRLHYPKNRDDVVK